MRIVDCEQGSPEWITARLGKVSASRVADMTARTKTGYSTSRANYAAELIAERLTGQRTEKYTNEAMQWGTDNEAQARSVYELMTDFSVTKVGLVLHPTIDMACASPDGLVGDEGMVEIKCPLTATHIDTLLTETIDGRYIKQTQWQMACCNRQWCDFVSFDPRLPEDLRLYVQRIERDEGVCAALAENVAAFCAEADALMERVAESRAK